MTQETHEALKLADELDAYHTRAGHKQAATKMREMHALIVQMAAALEKMEKATQTTAVHFQADASQQCSATLTAAKEYLK